MFKLSRLIISFTTFLIVIFGCIYSSTIVSSMVSPLVIQVENIQNNFGTTSDTSENLMLDLLNDWDKYNNFLGMIIRHNELDDIDVIFTRVHEYAKNGNEESFTVESEELIYRLTNLIEKEKFSLRNLF